MSAELLNLEAPNFTCKGMGGDDITITATFKDADLTSATHRMRLATTPDGEKFAEYGSGTGLTVSFGGTDTMVAINIPRATTATYRGQTIYGSYDITASSKQRTRFTFTLPLKKTVTG
jgi:hypothetical protein